MIPNNVCARIWEILNLKILSIVHHDNVYSLFSFLVNFHGIMPIVSQVNQMESSLKKT